MRQFKTLAHLRYHQRKQKCTFGENTYEKHTPTKKKSKKPIIEKYSIPQPVVVKHVESYVGHEAGETKNMVESYTSQGVTPVDTKNIVESYSQGAGVKSGDNYTGDYNNQPVKSAAELYAERYNELTKGGATENYPERYSSELAAAKNPEQFNERYGVPLEQQKLPENFGERYMTEQAIKNAASYAERYNEQQAKEIENFAERFGLPINFSQAINYGQPLNYSLPGGAANYGHHFNTL